MGYAGYAPTKYAPAPLTPLQESLSSLPIATLAIVEKLTYNAVVAPGDAKFRKVKLSNAKIKAAIVDMPGALAALGKLGWREADEDGEPVLLLGKNASMAQVRDIQEAQAKAKKAEEEAAKSARLTAAATGRGDRQSLRAQIEADKAERAAKEPVVTSSIAQKLPSGGTRVATARDAGIET